jgi:hypothetical protein
MRVFKQLAAALVFLAAASAAPAIEPTEIVDAQLARQSVQLVGFGDGQISFFNANRELLQSSASRYVSLTFQRPLSADAMDDSSPGLLHLADGQVIRGRFAGVTDDGFVQWDAPLLGKLAFPLDKISRFATAAPAAPAVETAPTAEAPPVNDAGAKAPALKLAARNGGVAVIELLDPRLANGKPPANAPPPQLETPIVIKPKPPAPPAPEDTSSDRVTLSNGDVVRGFVQNLKPSNLSIQSDNSEITLTWDRVARLDLANPTKIVPATWLRLTDGSRLAAANVSYSAGKLTALVLGNRPLELPAGQVYAIDFAQNHRLVPIAALKSKILSGGEVFGVPFPPILLSDTAQLHAPLALRLDLPAHTTRFAAEAALDPQSLDWADLTLIITDGEKTLFKQRLSAEAPTAAINIPLAGDTLVIQLDDGVNGPVRDRLRLRAASFLVGAP